MSLTSPRGLRLHLVLLGLALSIALAGMVASPAGAPLDRHGAKPGDAQKTADEAVRLNNLGIAHLAQYKPAEAEKLFRQAVALDAGYLPGLVNTGIAALAQAHYEDALAAFKRALEVDAASVYARFNLSQIYKLQGRTQEAIEEGLKALQVDGRDSDIHYHVGSLYLTTREYDKAITEFETVLKLDPNHLSAYYGLGRAWIARGDMEKGKRYIEKHRELQSGARATPAVGLRYGEQGKYSYAMEDTGISAPSPPLAKGQLTFVDVSAASGLDFEHGGGGLDPLRKPPVAAEQPTAQTLHRSVAPRLGSGLAVADVNGDGLEDLFFPDASPDGRGESTLYLNRGALRFEKASGPGAPVVRGSALSAAFGDLDGDGDADLVLGLLDRVRVLVNDGAGSFHEQGVDAAGSSAAAGSLLGGISLADVDHDGDLDIYAAGFLAAPAPGAAPSTQATFPAPWIGSTGLLLVNATAGAPPSAATAPAESAPVQTTLKFIESASRAGVGHAARRTVGAVFADFDNDRDIDLALASAGDRTSILSNQRDASFSDLGPSSGLPAASPILGLAAADYNKDGWIDLAATSWEGGLPRLFRNMLADPLAGSGKTGAFALDVNAFTDVSRQIAVPQLGVAFADLDNDGQLDLVTVNGGDTGPALFVFRNEGAAGFSDAGGVTGADQISARNGRGLVAADLDLDGDLDLVIANSGGRPTLLRNDGGNKNHWVRVAPTGLHSNRPGVGAKIEVKSGRLWQKIEVTAGSGYLSQGSLIPHFGLGSSARVDAVRVLWPGGVLQDEVQVKADALFAVKELDRKGSSCPILYAWDGARMAFVSDFLGGSAIGARTGLDSFNHPDTDEYVRVTADQLKPRDGVLDLRMVNQLEETIFFDRARLLAVDHPAGVEMFPDERLMPGPPYPPFRVFMVADARPPVAAQDDEGNDVRVALSHIDRVFVEPPPTWRFRGYTRPHSLTLDLGEVPAGSPVVLLLHGWIDYADSTSNLAAAQAGVELVPPYVEALDGDRWVPLLSPMGSPAGLPKTMTVDLTGKLPPGAHVVRISTSMRIYWDQARVATGLGGEPRITALEADRASLRYRGFPALVERDGRPPESYDYASDQPVHWKSMVGAFTRYGDVRELLQAVDDRYVITRPGDEVSLEFPAAALPPVPAGQVRDYLLFADGFGKDMDINSARPDTVAPLPRHAMVSYPPPHGAGSPHDTDDIMRYIDTYNTRFVLAPLMPLSPPRQGER